MLISQLILYQLNLPINKIFSIRILTNKNNWLKTQSKKSKILRIYKFKTRFLGDDKNLQIHALVKLLPQNRHKIGHGFTRFTRLRLITEPHDALENHVILTLTRSTFKFHVILQKWVYNIYCTYYRVVANFTLSAISRIFLDLFCFTLFYAQSSVYITIIM